MTRPAIQLYTLRNVDRPLIELLELVADAGFEGVEFGFRVGEVDPEDVVAALEETGLEVAGAHVDVEALEDDFAETVTLYEELTADDIVVPMLDAEQFESREAVESAVERLEYLDAELDEYGMEFHYHNHDHEYVDLDGERVAASPPRNAEAVEADLAFDYFLHETEFAIELDLGLALAAGDDPVERLRSLGDRSESIHLKDYDVELGESVPVGRGDLDLEGVAAAAEENDSDWLVYEYPGEDPMDSLDEAAAVVRDLC